MTSQSALKNLKLASASIIAVAAGVTATPSYAQSDGPTYQDEIIVTARRKAESLQDVPGSITAITQATLEKAGVQRVEDFIGLTPGVTLVLSLIHI